MKPFFGIFVFSSFVKIIRSNRDMTMQACSLEDGCVADGLCFYWSTNWSVLSDGMGNPWTYHMGMGMCTINSLNVVVTWYNRAKCDVVSLQELHIMIVSWFRMIYIYIHRITYIVLKWLGFSEPLLPNTTCHTSTVEDDTFPQANFGRGPGGTCTAGKPDSLGHGFQRNRKT